MSAIAKMRRVYTDHDAKGPGVVTGYECASCNNTLSTRPVINADWKFCPYCGVPIHPIIYEVPKGGNLRRHGNTKRLIKLK